MFVYDKGIRLNGSSLWLDASRKVENCVVSHGHMDHAKKHRFILATDKTVHILKHRIGETRSQVLSFREPFDFDGYRVTLYPAGHILGSAQILIEANGRRLLYSGDFNLQNSSTAEPIDIPESDILIMECTFGRPKYSFPNREKIAQELLLFIEQALNCGQVPVIIGYALGKSQEAMKLIGDAGYHMAVHSSVAKLTRIYETYGIHFGNWESLDKEDFAGKVLMVTPQAAKNKFLERFERKRTLFLSGWAVDRGFKYRVKTDAVLPLSDHADFKGLIEYAAKVNASKIYTTHGFEEFALHLRSSGYDAQPLKQQKQIELF